MGNLSINIEAKNFLFLRAADKEGIQIQERCKGKVRIVVLGFASAKWLLRVLSDMRSREGDDMKYSTYKEGRKAYVVQERMNFHGRYLEIVEFGFGSMRGLVVVPRGRNGEGWVAFERQVAESLKVINGGRDFMKRTKETKGVFSSFAEAVKGRGSGNENNYDIPRHRSQPSWHPSGWSQLTHSSATEKTMQEVWLMLQRHKDELAQISNLVASCLPHGQTAQQVSQHLGQGLPQMSTPATKFLVQQNVNKNQPSCSFNSPQGQCIKPNSTPAQKQNLSQPSRIPKSNQLN